MVSKAEGPLCPHNACWVLGGLRDDAAPLGQRQGAAEVATTDEKELQTSKKAQLPRTVFEHFRKLQSTPDSVPNLVAMPFGEHRRQCECVLQNHLRSGATAHDVESRQRPFAPASAFLEQGQTDEKRRRPRGKLNPDSNIAMIRE